MWILFALISFMSMAGEVSPTVTDPGIRMVKGNHLYYQPVKSNGKTLITIGGTNSTPAQFKNVHDWALKSGYRVLAVDYENEVTSVLCWKETDLNCYDNYRKEIVLGLSGSPLVNVSKTNSLVNRIEKLLKYLNWTLNWKDAVLVGHSQGSGHAAYLAKRFEVSKVIMTGGPHDYMKGHGAARWTHARSKTDPANFFAFLHKNDFYGTTPSIEASEALMERRDIRKIKDSIPRFSDAQIFITSLEFPDPHNSFTDPKFEKVWSKLLE